MNKLSQLMEKILETNPDLAERMTIHPRDIDNSSDTSTIRSPASTSPRTMSFRSSFGFERALKKSRVYAKAERNISTTSFESLNTTESNWSQLTGLSLSQTSCISVIRLPISAPELYNSAPYAELRPEVTETIGASILIDEATRNVLMLGYPPPARYMHPGEISWPTPPPTPISQFTPAAPINEIPNLPIPVWRTKGFHLGSFDFELPGYDSDGISKLVKQTQLEETTPDLSTPHTSESKIASPLPEPSIEHNPEIATQNMEYDADEDEPHSVTTNSLQSHKVFGPWGKPLLEIQTPRVNLQFGHSKLADIRSRGTLRSEIAKIVQEAIAQQDLDSTQPHVFMSSQQPLSVREYRELEPWQHNSDDSSLVDMLEPFNVSATTLLQPPTDLNFRPPSDRYQTGVSDDSLDITFGKADVMGSPPTLSATLEVDTTSDSVSDPNFEISEVAAGENRDAQQLYFHEKPQPRAAEHLGTGASSTYLTITGGIRDALDAQVDAHALDLVTSAHLLSDLEIERAEVATNTSREILHAEHLNFLEQIHLGAVPADQPGTYPAEAISNVTEDMLDAGQNKAEAPTLERETPDDSISDISNDIAEMVIMAFDEITTIEQSQYQIPKSTSQSPSPKNTTLARPTHLPESTPQTPSTENTLKIPNSGIVWSVVWAYAISLPICVLLWSRWWVG